MLRVRPRRRRRVDRGGEAGMEDGLLIMLLVFLFPANPTHFDRALPVPSSHPQTGWSANTPRAARERVERFACARFAVGCGIEVCFSRNAPLFFYDKIAAEAALTVF